ncbi:hypothetical protein [Acinetobacter radioresistens]|uniref:hypothetical protein n=1 Tax=Acinetobacter radioresistens TaxID=40216 RepID=UPI003215DC88
MTTQVDSAALSFPFENKLLVYIYLTPDANIPYNFASVAGDVEDTHISELNSRAVEPVLNDYRHIRMTYILKPTFDLSKLQELCESVKKIIADKTGFVVKTVIEQEI